MAKLIGITILIIAALAILNRQKIADYKQKVIEAVNPAAKETRLLGELQNNLNDLSQIKAGDQQKLNAIVGNAKSVLEEINNENQKSDLPANLSNLIEKIVPLDLKPSPTWLPPSATCHPNPN